MSHGTTSPPDQDLAARLALFQDLPFLHEDDPERDMGEANLHALAEHILRYGIAAHLAALSEYCVFSNMNLYHQPRFPRLYVSPDVMVVKPTVSRPDRLRSFRIGEHGPLPLLVAEVLSEETAEEEDLKEKVFIYAMIGVEEYLLVDGDGRFLPQRLLMKRLQPDRTWIDERDPDGGVTSRLGFRVLFENDGRLRILDATSGAGYARPDEAEAEARARRQAEDYIRKLEAELERLRGASPSPKAKKPPTQRRRKKS